MVFWFSKSSSQELHCDSSSIMKDICSHVVKQFHNRNFKYAFLWNRDGETNIHPFVSSSEGLVTLDDCFTQAESIGTVWPNLSTFFDKSNELFKDIASNAKKVLNIHSAVLFRPGF